MQAVLGLDAYSKLIQISVSKLWNKLYYLLCNPLMIRPPEICDITVFHPKKDELLNHLPPRGLLIYLRYASHTIIY